MANRLRGSCHSPQGLTPERPAPTVARWYEGVLGSAGMVVASLGLVGITTGGEDVRRTKDSADVLGGLSGAGGVWRRKPPPPAPSSRGGGSHVLCRTYSQ